MAEPHAESFEVLGDADALPDAFFDALAALLLDVSQIDNLQQDAVEEDAPTRHRFLNRRRRVDSSDAEHDG